MRTSLTTQKFILVIIVLLAAFLRLFNLGNVPPSPSMDEASISYNAYSVLKTGGDEYGELPIFSHRSYDDWRRAPYLYLVIPFVAVFNLETISVRFPAVILSILTVLVSYYIILYLFPKRSSYSETVAFLGAFLLAISPWHIYISRLGHESNAYFSFFIFGVLFFLKGEKTKSWPLLFLSMGFFVLSMVSYYAGQVFIPIFVLGIFFIFRKSLLSVIVSNKRILLVLFGCILLLIPLFYQLFSPSALVRFQGTSTFKPEAHWELFKKRVDLRNKALENNDIVGRVFYSSHLFPVIVLIQGYSDHFKPEWLFSNSSSGQPHKVPNMGLLYLWEIPFIVLGFIVLLLSQRVDSRAKKIIFLWFFIAALPASIATQTPHAMRAYTFLPTWQIFTAFGLIYVFFALKKIKLAAIIVFAILIFYSLYTIYKNYYIVFPKEQSKSFSYALSKAIPYVLSKQDGYRKIVFSNKDNLYQSYMLFLYHSRYDPKKYLKNGGTVSGGFAETHKIDNIEFRPIVWEKDKNLKNTLFIGNISEFPPSVRPEEIIKELNGKDAIQIVNSL